jgi:CelD/BcsL family acetyltransferase involved in cellulose biosynthesis/RimJ/RimL family protein N-acetyltransferase
MTVLPAVELRVGDAALQWLAQDKSLAQWQALAEASLHATAYQRHGFVSAWYAAYAADWTPVLAMARNADGGLVALWPLAHHAQRRELAHAGAHQAEYHGWLAQPGLEVAFLQAAWQRLLVELPFATLRFRYLVHPELAAMLQAVPGLGEQTEVRHSKRPLMRLDGAEIEASFAKKSNRSRVNRLRRLGELRFEPVVDDARFESFLQPFIDFYDFRQGAVNQTLPFREDGRKRDFHRRLFAQTRELAVTGLFLGGQPIAAFWGMRSGTTMHLGMMAHSPTLAEHSPGKLLLMELSRHLLAEGLASIDLTPGGDAWKERFANDHDDVVEVMLHRSRQSLRAADRRATMLATGKRLLGLVGISPAAARSALAQARRATPAALARRAARLLGTEREFRVYRREQTGADEAADDGVAVNDLQALMAFEPGESWQSRAQFLSSALARLEQGESAFTVMIDGRLAHVGWLVPKARESHMTEVGQHMRFPEASAALYDFYTHPDFRGRGLYRRTIRQMLRHAFADPQLRYAYISVLADNRPSRHVIESLGFEHQRSYHLRQRFGRSATWTTPDPLPQG